MIRRDVLTRRDNRAVKWSLIAATLALSVGLYAEHTLSAQIDEEEAATAVVQESAPVPAPAAIAG